MDTEKRRSFLINIAYFAVIFLLVFLLFRYGLSMISPFVVAFIIAFILKRPILFLHEKLRIPAKLSAVAAVILFYGTVGALLTLLGVKVVTWVIALVEELPALYEMYVLPAFMDVFGKIEAVFMDMDPQIAIYLDHIGTNIISSTGDLISGISVKVIGLSTSVAASIPGLFIKLVLMLISTFFIAIDYDRLTGFCLLQMGKKTKEVFFQIKEYVAGTLWVCIRSYALIMSITFVELSIGFSIIGIKRAVLVALCISIFDILPVLGTGGIMLPWAVIAAIQGNYRLAISLLVVYIVVTVVRNILEPKIVGSQLGLHPVVTLCSMFVGAQLLGVVGLFGFPIGLSLLRHLNDHGVIRVFRSV